MHRVLVNENLEGALGFALGADVGATAAGAATAKAEADLQEGKIDLPGAADATARAVADTAGAAGGAAACAAVGAAVASPLCAAIGQEIAGAVYDVGKKIIEGLFGGESVASKAAKAARAASSASHRTQMQLMAVTTEANKVIAAVGAQVRETEQQLGTKLFATNDEFVLKMAEFGAPYKILMVQHKDDPGECYPADRGPGQELTIALPGGCELLALEYRTAQWRDKEHAKKKGKAFNDRVNKGYSDTMQTAYAAAIKEMPPILDRIRKAAALMLIHLTVVIEVAKAAARRRAPPKLQPVARPEPPRRAPPKLAPIPRRAPSSASVPAASTPSTASTASRAPTGGVVYGPYP